MHVLRFEAGLVSNEPDDENRKFIFSFFCGDDTIKIYELCDKKSGRIGEPFMEQGDICSRNQSIRKYVVFGARKESQKNEIIAVYYLLEKYS